MLKVYGPESSAPIPKAKPVEKVQTVEQTSKSWKFIQLVGGFGVVLFCLLWLNAAAQGSLNNVEVFKVIMCGCGVFYLYGRIGAWWYHG